MASCHFVRFLIHIFIVSRTPPTQQRASAQSGHRGQGFIDPIRQR